MRKRVIILALCLAMLLCLLPALAAADGDEQKCGDNLYWSLYEDTPGIMTSSNGTLTISGTGDMYDFSYETQPWASVRDRIKHVVVSEGVTSIGCSAFSGAEALMTVSLSDTVKTIGGSAFFNCNKLTSLSLGKGVTTIGSWAFYECKSLYSLVLPSSVEYVDNVAFGECTALTSLTVKGSATLDDGAFSCCSSLKYLTLPCSAQINGTVTFESCVSIANIHVTKGTGTMSGSFENLLGDACTVWEDGEPVYVNAPELTVVIDEGVKNIADFAFAGVDYLSLPASMEEIGDYALAGTPKVVLYGGTEAQRAAIVIGEGNEGLQSVAWQYVNSEQRCGDTLNWSFAEGTGTLTIVGIGDMWDMYGAWENDQYEGAVLMPWRNFKDKIKKIVLPEGLTSIGSAAFATLSNLESVKLPSTLTTIRSWAFGDCSRLTSVTIPKKVGSVGECAFYDCPLTTLTIKGTAWIDMDAFWGNSLTTVTMPCTIMPYSYNSIPLFGSTPVTIRLTKGSGNEFMGSTDNTVAEGILEFFGNEDPEQPYPALNVTIDEGVHTIGAYAFDGAVIETLTLPSSLTKVEDGAAGFFIGEVVYGGTQTQRAAMVIGNDNQALVDATWHYLPVITAHPAAVTVTEGQAATFQVVAADAESYLWQYMKPGDTSWTNVSKNGKSATYTLTAALRHDGYSYRCQVKSPSGTVISDAAKLTVKAPKPTITTQPASVTVAEGKKATFTVVATGADSYKWQYQKPGSSTWTSVSKNGDAATYTLTTAVKHNGYAYRCAVKNAAGTTYSKTVTLTVKVKPTITTQPKAVTVYVGKTATFKVVAEGADSYKWQYQKPGSSTWTNVSKNGTAAIYSLTTAAKHDGYAYRCAVKNGAGTVYSNAVKLTVSEKPVITSQPKAASVTAGKKATFKVVADGATSYKWQYQKPGSSTWTDVSKNGTSATYTLTTAARHNGYKYRCKVTNDKGSVYTSIVTLTVK